MHVFSDSSLQPTPTHLHPESRKLGTQRGAEYLTHRMHLLQHYCTLAAFYLMLRSEQRQQQRGALAIGAVGKLSSSGRGGKAAAQAAAQAAVATTAAAAKSHPCLAQLVAARALIEALEPMHEKIQPQV
jgi:hypothetical protein